MGMGLPFPNMRLSRQQLAATAMAVNLGLLSLAALAPAASLARGGGGGGGGGQWGGGGGG